MRTISTLVFLAALLAVAAAEQSSGSKARKESALSKIVPRLLWNLKRGDNQESHRNSQPIIIVQQPSKNSDYDEDKHYHHHRPHYPYYPYYPPPPPPSRPPPQFPGMEYMSATGSGPTYLIINPNNAQGIYLPSSSSNSTNSTSARRSAFVPTIADLLQGLSLDDLSDGSLFEDDSDVVEAAEDGTVELAADSNGSSSLAHDDRDEDLVSEEEIEALDRQSNRGVSPKHLVSILMQDKRRRRIQEVLAGIYMRNYNLNRK